MYICNYVSEGTESGGINELSIIHSTVTYQTWSETVDDDDDDEGEGEAEAMPGSAVMQLHLVCSVYQIRNGPQNMECCVFIDLPYSNKTRETLFRA